MHGTTAVPSAAAARAIRTGATLMAVAAAGFIGYALLFLARNFTDSFLELGIGPAEVNVGRDQIQQFSPSLYHYISHLHLAVAGFIAATGLAVLLLVLYGVRAGQAWAWVAAVAAPVLGLAVALPAHYPWNLDTLGHLGLIYLATLVFVAGALLSGKGLLDARRTTGRCSGTRLAAASRSWSPPRLVKRQRRKHPRCHRDAPLTSPLDGWEEPGHGGLRRGRRWRRISGLCAGRALERRPGPVGLPGRGRPRLRPLR
jgi:hypothetical protein